MSAAALAIGRHLPAASAHLLDPRTGLLTGVSLSANRPEWPPAFRWVLADVAPIGRVLPLPADTTATGTAFGDADIARAAAVGEAVERYCGNAVPDTLRRSTFTALERAGERAVDPARLVLYSARDYVEPGSPFVEFSRDLEVLWVEGQDLIDSGSTWVPASLVWVNWFIGERAHEAPTNFVNYAGLAAGASRTDAEGAALEELLERDATEIWWRTRGPMARVEPDRETAELLALPDDSAVELMPLQIPSPFGVPVRIVVARDRASTLLTIGVAARLEEQQAIRKAAGEAISLLALAHGLLDPEGSLWQEMELSLLDDAPYRPWRPDRSYRESYRADLRDIIDLGCQAQWYLDPANQQVAEGKLAAMLTGDPPPPDRDLRGADRRAAYVELLAESGLHPVSVELTTPDVARAGLAVVRVVVPGLVPNAPAAFACSGGTRLFTEPVRMGWSPAPLTVEDLCPIPLPHT